MAFMDKSPNVEVHVNDVDNNKNFYNNNINNNNINNSNINNNDNNFYNDNVQVLVGSEGYFKVRFSDLNNVNDSINEYISNNNNIYNSNINNINENVNNNITTISTFLNLLTDEINSNLTTVHKISILNTHHHHHHNNSNSNYNNFNNLFATTFISILFIAIELVGLIGNSMVIIVVLSDKEMRKSSTNLFITNLAFADLWIMLTGVMEITLFIGGLGWPYSLEFCKLERSLVVASLYASMLTLMAVCVERFIAIIFPLKAHMICRRRRILPIIFLMWLFSLLSSAPIVLYNQLTPPLPPSYVQRCQIMVPGKYGKALYKLVEMIIFFFVPVFLQIVLYGIVAKKLYTSSLSLHNAPRIIINPDRRYTNPCPTTTTSTTTTTTTTTAITTNNNKQRLSTIELSTAPSFGSLSNASNYNYSSIAAHNGKKKKVSETVKSRKEVVKMLVACVLIYFFSYLPQQVLSIYNMVTGNDLKVTWSFFVFIMALSYVNSASNPVLYAIFSQKFRTKFKVLLSCRKGANNKKNNGRRKSRGENYTTTTNNNTMIRRISTSPGFMPRCSSTVASSGTVSSDKMNFMLNTYCKQSTSTTTQLQQEHQ